jgi:hypothetical protein
MKKAIAKHILGLTGVGILWFIVNQILDSVFGQETKRWGRGESYLKDLWETDIYDDGGRLLLGMLVGYFAIYWSVKTIWFDKNKDSQKGD